MTVHPINDSKNSFSQFVEETLGAIAQPPIPQPSSGRTTTVARVWHAVWLVLVVVGFSSLIVYASIPGTSSVKLNTWPAEVTIQPTAHQACLVFFLHPRCPCTKASLAQLEELLEKKTSEPLSVKVIVFEPADVEPKWSQTKLVAQAEKLPHSEIIHDRDGQQAERFGAFTSGHVLLFDAQKNLIYSGGITPSRGHIGPCNGYEFLSQWMRGETAVAGQASATYGCPIITAGRNPCAQENVCTPQ